MATEFMIKLLTILSSEKIKSLQYNAALAITGSIRGTSREKIFDKFFFWSPFNKDAGIENYVSFSRYIKANAQNTFLIKFLNQIVNIELEMHKTSPISM